MSSSLAFPFVPFAEAAVPFMGGCSTKTGCGAGATMGAGAANAATGAGARGAMGAGAAMGASGAGTIGAMGATGAGAGT